MANTPVQAVVYPASGPRDSRKRPFPISLFNPDGSPFAGLTSTPSTPAASGSAPVVETGVALAPGDTYYGPWVDLTATGGALMVTQHADQAAVVSIDESNDKVSVRQLAAAASAAVATVYGATARRYARIVQVGGATPPTINELVRKVL